MFSSKFTKQDDNQRFADSLSFWGKKLSALLHQLRSSSKYAGDKRKEFDVLLEDYQQLVNWIFNLLG